MTKDNLIQKKRKVEKNIPNLLKKLINTSTNGTITNI